LSAFKDPVTYLLQSVTPVCLSLDQKKHDRWSQESKGIPHTCKVTRWGNCAYFKQAVLLSCFYFFIFLQNPDFTHMETT